MANYQLTNKAVDDLSQIWKYTLEVWSEKQADIYYQKLIVTFQEIAISPNSGRNYTNVVENLLGFKVNKHIIFYRILTEDNIEIIRVLHEQMDLKNRLLE